ncbi:hypothetical protein A2818_01505 [Candidatus Nomurabacteria bacterium RIFCSPHIGHO2_01_FULL_40_12]|uniref:Aspartate kinase n=1 Tax=Candidatus Nomurabacteria bacterium RIFCSPHIGHO2_01_FULL_40_12 TaxID=1801737 RepID=A0A1F6V152_9BACT|nr:MAG: hypothetical protein A2818_01505 [Candidatus Nomurabacteria bacterium RIFCSPHIGHO2_01_FULL_40_12]
MITISQVVKDIINHSPFLSEVLYEDMANISGIARQIQPQIEKKLLEEVSEESIAMALRRIKRRLKAPVSDEEILKDTKNISVRSNLIEFVFSNSPDIIKIHQEILKITEKKKDSFFNISIGHLESTIIVSNELEKDIDKILKGQANIMKIKDLSSITMKFSDKLTLATPGVYYVVLKALAWNGISAIEVASIGWEFNMLFKDDTVDRAFSVIKSLTL